MQWMPCRQLVEDARWSKLSLSTSLSPECTPGFGCKISAIQYLMNNARKVCHNFDLSLHALPVSPAFYSCYLGQR